MNFEVSSIRVKDFVRLPKKMNILQIIVNQKSESKDLDFFMRK